MARRSAGSMMIRAAQAILSLAAFPSATFAQANKTDRFSDLPRVICDVEPRTLEEIETLETAAMEIPDTSLDLRFVPEIPIGVPADPHITNAVTQTLLEMVACSLEDDGLRWYAVVTDRYIQVLAGSEDPPLTEYLLATPVSDEPVNPDLHLAHIERVTLLTDGRVTAIVTLGGIDNAHPAPGRTSIMFFAVQDGRWLYDGNYEEVWSGSQDTEQVWIADLYPPPASAAATPAA